MESGAALLLGGMARVAMSIIFAQSAWHALRDPALHAARVAAYRVVPAWAATPAAWGLPLASAAAACMLLVPEMTHAGAALGLALMAAFTAVIAINVRRGRLYIDCGCGGAQGQRISGGLVARNVVLMAMLAAACAAPAAGGDLAAAVAMVAGGAALVTLYFAASQLLANQAAFRHAGFVA
jgi:hypothetical protein